MKWKKVMYTLVEALPFLIVKFRRSNQQIFNLIMTLKVQDTTYLFARLL